ncbi:transposon Ty3-I Gag-Pol polyprotein [Biomphalaria glabrata]
MHTLGLASKKVAEESMEKAAREVKEKVGISNEEGITDCDVSVDGTWQRRGHSSHHSGVAAKSIETGKGRLTDRVIDTLPNFYGLAIRQNTNTLDNMIKSVNSVLEHVASTDDNPQHQHCSIEWCGYLQNHCKISISMDSLKLF